jgi:HPt (histidine-containing phosphotransfer) domain-containing protein
VDPLKSNGLIDDLGDKPESLMYLFHCFITETQKDINHLRSALNLGNAGKVAQTAHRIKGAAGTIGAEPLRAEAARVEAFGRQGELDHALAGAENIQQEFDRFCCYVAELARAE